MSDELRCDLGEALIASLRPERLDRDSPTLDPTEFAQSLHKSGDPLAIDRRRGRAQEPDGRQLCRLLRTRSERPSRRAANKCDEIASSHRLPQGLGPRQSIDDYSRDLRQAKWGSGVSLHGSNPELSMSALGQEQTSQHVRLMSALPPKADIAGVRLGQATLDQWVEQKREAEAAERRYWRELRETLDPFNYGHWR